MGRIGKFEYPDRGTFTDALLIAKEALEKYGGVIPYRVAAEKFGYNIKTDASISGWIYKRFDDVCIFGLLTREKKCMKTTDLAIKALDPTDTARAAEGKAEAVRKVQLIAKAYDEWNGEIPSETAFPAKIASVTGVNWVEAKKHTKALMTIFGETFPYLKAAPELPAAEVPKSKVSEEIEKPAEEGMVPLTPSPWLEGKVGGVYVRIPRSKKGLETAKKLLELLEAEIPDEENMQT